jgi:hypothetical protein
MIKDSFISLPKDKVIELCEKTIAHINERRQREDDRYLNKIVRRRNKSWVRRLRKKPEVTLEQIREEYKDYSYNFIFPSIYAWGTLDTAERVLKIAKASEDIVYVSSSDFDSIS